MTENGTPLPLLSRYAIMIDVGYIYAAAGELLFSASYRHEYRVDAADLIQALTREAGEQIRGDCSGSTGTTRPGTGCPPSTSGSSPRCRGSSCGSAT